MQAFENTLFFLQCPYRSSRREDCADLLKGSELSAQAAVGVVDR